MEAVIVGGSLGGLNAAINLREAGLRVTIFERSPRPLEGKGAGIVLHPSTVRLFDDARAVEWRRITASAHHLTYLDRRGRIAHSSPCSFRFSSYQALHAGLLRALGEDHYHLGREMVAVHPLDDQVEIRLADGTDVRCDLLVCADGIRSKARQLLFPNAIPSYSGYVGWRGTVSRGGLSTETSDLLEGAITYYLGHKTHMLAYPIPASDGSVERGRRLTNWVWYRNVTPVQFEAMLEDRLGSRHDMSIGPGAIQDSFVEQLRRDAEHVLPPQLAETVQQTEAPFVQGVYDGQVPKMVLGNICLIGDAAFVIRPHLAVGTAKAAEDAWTLRRALRIAGGAIADALRRWEPAQLDLGRELVSRAQRVGRQLQFDDTWPIGKPLPFGLRRSGDSML